MFNSTALLNFSPKPQYIRISIITKCGWNGITKQQINALFKFFQSQIIEGFIDSAFKMVVNGIKKANTDCKENSLDYFLKLFADRREGGDLICYC